MSLQGVRKSKRDRGKQAAHYHKMGQDFFSNLPSEITSNILLRLPIRTTMSCKCVCKPWLNLLETREFAKSHLSKSVPGVATFVDGVYPKPSKFFEFVDELNPKPNWCRWNMIFNLPCVAPPYSSVDGLLFLCTDGGTYDEDNDYEYVTWSLDLFICNPITREYIKLPCPPESSLKRRVVVDTFGFGVSRISGQYKLVRIFHECSMGTLEIAQSKCQVYTVGSGSWSRVASAGPFKYKGNAKGAFLNGNLHWMVHDFEGSSVWISCFDLETELFSTFSLPPGVGVDDDEHYLSVSALNGCLYLCDNTEDAEIVIWLMKEYGDEKCWTKEFVICKINPFYIHGLLHPVKIFKNGDILIAQANGGMLYYFSSRTKTIGDTDLCGSPRSPICAISYTPSFLPLKSFLPVKLEKVSGYIRGFYYEVLTRNTYGMNDFARKMHLEYCEVIRKKLGM